MFKLKVCLSIFILILLTYNKVILAKNNNTGVWVSKDQVANTISKENNILIEQSLDQLTQKETEILSKLYNGSPIPKSAKLSYKRFEIEKEVSGINFRTWAYAQIWSEGSFYEIVQVVHTGSGYSGMNASKFEPNVTTVITSPLSILLTSMCYFTGETNFAVSDKDKDDFIKNKFIVVGDVGKSMSVDGSLDYTEIFDLN